MIKRAFNINTVVVVIVDYIFQVLSEKIFQGG